MGHGTAPGGRRVFPRTFTFTFDEDDDGKPHLNHSINLRCDKEETKCRLNGKLCRIMSDEEGRDKFSPAE